MDPMSVHYDGPGCFRCSTCIACMASYLAVAWGITVIWIR